MGHKNVNIGHKRSKVVSKYVQKKVMKQVINKSQIVYLIRSQKIENQSQNNGLLNLSHNFLSLSENAWRIPLANNISLTLYISPIYYYYRFIQCRNMCLSDDDVMLSDGGKGLQISGLSNDAKTIIIML